MSKDRTFHTSGDDGQGDEPGSAQVLCLHDFGSDPSARVVAEMRDYWTSLRQGRAVPARSDVEPRGIRRGLDYAFIVERIAPGAARFRLAGRHLIDLIGMEVRGMPICSFVNPSSRGWLSDVLETVFKAPQIAEITLEADSGYARPELKARMLLLPLKSDLGDVTRALGCLIATGDLGIAPRRFDMKDARVSAIIDGAVPMQPTASVRAFKEETAPWKSGGAAERKKKSTRLLTTDGKEPIKTADESYVATTVEQSPETRRAAFRVVSRDR